MQPHSSSERSVACFLLSMVRSVRQRYARRVFSRRFLHALQCIRPRRRCARCARSRLPAVAAPKPPRHTTSAHEPMSAVPVTHMSPITAPVGISQSHSQIAWATRSEVGTEEVRGDGPRASSTSAVAAGMVTSASLVSWPVLMGTPLRRGVLP
jgi:hypothetical protein